MTTLFYKGEVYRIEAMSETEEAEEALEKASPCSPIRPGIPADLGNQSFCSREATTVEFQPKPKVRRLTRIERPVLISGLGEPIPTARAPCLAEDGDKSFWSFDSNEPLESLMDHLTRETAND
jgi:hypothetical protein